MMAGTIVTTESANLSKISKNGDRNFFLIETISEYESFISRGHI